MVRFEWFKFVLDGSLPRRYESFNLIRRLLFKFGIKSVNEFIVVSDDLRCWLQDTIKIEQPITLVPCLLNISPEILASHVSPETEAALASFLKHEKRVCSSGIFIPSYGFEHVVAAVEKIRCESGVDIGLVLIDGAFASQEDYQDHVLGAREWVTVLSNVPNLEVHQILIQCDVFVRGFEFESYGISRIEAIWRGVPVIATTAGETRGMLTYDFADVDQLTRLLKHVLFHGADCELSTWAELYRREADANLRVLKRAIGLDAS
jgi:glycosyltransferase involved in cell wall biosynthesis